MSDLTLADVGKRYGNFVAVEGVSLSVRAGEFLTLLGPSGCGKTTTLRMVAGFIKPDSGAILLGDRDVTQLPPYRRNTGMVFQSYALFPHLTVADNVAFGLKVRKLSKADVRRRVGQALELVQLSHLGDRYPRQLSGGQQQRVALARAVAIEPDILLLDEPLAALDLKLRQELQVEIKRVQQALNITTLYVTHDQGEALSLSDRIAVMNQGRVEQLGDPLSLYRHPASRFVANFLGRTNLIDVEVIEGAREGLCTVRSIADPQAIFKVSDAGCASSPVAGQRMLLGFRPETAACNDNNINELKASIEKVAYFGSVWSISLTSPIAPVLHIEHRGDGVVPRSGDTVVVSWKPTDCFLLPAT